MVARDFAHAVTPHRLTAWAKSREAEPPPYPASSRQRQRRRLLDLFHGKAGRDVFERNGSDELLVEAIIAMNIRHHDPQHIVDVAGHPIEFHHLRHRADSFGESL